MKFTATNPDPIRRLADAKQWGFTVFRLRDGAEAFSDRRPRRDSKYWDETEYLIWNNKDDVEATPAGSANPAIDRRWERATLARDPAVTPEAAAKLAADADVVVRMALAENPALTPELMAMLSADDNANVRAVLAGNPAVTPEQQSVLAADDDVDVRRALARNRAVTSVVAARLAADTDADVRRVMAAVQAVLAE